MPSNYGKPNLNRSTASAAGRSGVALDEPPRSAVPERRVAKKPNRDVTASLLGENDGEDMDDGATGTGSTVSTALQGVAMMIMGAQKLGSVLPGSIPPQITTYLEMLKQTIPQTLQQLAQVSNAGQLSPELAGALGQTPSIAPQSPMLGMMGVAPQAGMGGQMPPQQMPPQPSPMAGLAQGPQGGQLPPMPPELIQMLMQLAAEQQEASAGGGGGAGAPMQ